eukprot:Skav218382  [mRNA]  locus=scaffold2066:323244:348006:- [translate_table: standard]
MPSLSRFPIMARSLAIPATGKVNKELLDQSCQPAFQKLLDHCFVCKTTKDRPCLRALSFGRGSTVPLRLEMVDAVRVQNGAAWMEYSKAWSTGCAVSCGRVLLEDDSDVKLRFALLRMASHSDSVVPVLCHALKDRRRRVRLHATKARRRGAVNAVDAIAECLSDGQSHVRAAAARALGQIGGKHSEKAVFRLGDDGREAGEDVAQHLLQQMQQHTLLKVGMESSTTTDVAFPRTVTSRNFETLETSTTYPHFSTLLQAFLDSSHAGDFQAVRQEEL